MIRVIDEEILSTLAHFQERIQEISMRFQEIKDIAYDLYQENEELKEENEHLKKMIFDEKKREDSKRKGYSNLIHLYNEGYHICHLSFGEKRQGDCLFCIQLLEHRFDEKINVENDKVNLEKE